MIKTPVHFLCLTLLFLSVHGCQKEKLSQLGIYVEETYRSDQLAEDFKIFTFLPSGYLEQNSYPVIFLMDAEWYFEKMARELEVMMESGQLPDCILVGIGYQDFDESKRFRDYTFPADSEYDIITGEANQYHDFLEKDLIPYLEAKYSIDANQRILMGHSLGGLNAVYALLRQAVPVFTGIVAISPSLWWSDQRTFGLEKDFWQSGNDLSAKVYIAVGTDEPPSMTILARELSDRLLKRNYSDLDLKFSFYEGASHGQTPIRGFSDGLTFIFN